MSKKSFLTKILFSVLLLFNTFLFSKHDILLDKNNVALTGHEYFSAYLSEVTFVKNEHAFCKDAVIALTDGSANRHDGDDEARLINFFLGAIQNTNLRKTDEFHSFSESLVCMNADYAWVKTDKRYWNGKHVVSVSEKSNGHYLEIVVPGYWINLPDECNVSESRCCEWTWREGTSEFGLPCWVGCYSDYFGFYSKRYGCFELGIAFGKVPGKVSDPYKVPTITHRFFKPSQKKTNEVYYLNPLFKFDGHVFDPRGQKLSIAHWQEDCVPVNCGELLIIPVGVGQGFRRANGWELWKSS